MSARRRLAVLVAQIATVLGLLFGWSHDSPNLEMGISRPTAVYHALRTWLTNGALRSYIPVTLKEELFGFALGLGVALALALILASSRVLTEFCEPFIAVVNALPKFALGPLFVLVFGIHFLSKVYFVATAVFFVPFIAIFTAITTIDHDLLHNIRALGAGRRDLLQQVYVPATLSAVISSLRITATFALLAAVVSELIASTSGIGYEISSAQQNLQADFVLAGVLIVAAIAFFLDRLLVLFERRFSYR